MQVTLRKQGNSTGFTIPPELLARLRLQAGDAVTITETPDGFVVSKRDEDFERQLDLGHAVMKKRRKILDALAK